MTKISLTYCGMPGTGQTVKEAKQDAARKIEAALALNYEPTVIQTDKHLALVWNTPNGVVSAYVHDGKIRGTSHSAQSFQEVVDCVRYNIATLECDINSNEIPALIRGNKYQEREFRSWIGFQRAFQFAKTQNLGLPSNQDSYQHQWACEHGSEYAPVTLNS